MNADIRNLAKWLNEEQEAPIDRQALARVLAMAEQPAQQEPGVKFNEGMWQEREARITQLEAELMRMQGRELKLQFALAEQPAQQEPVGYVSSVQSNSPLMCGLSEWERKGLIALYTSQPASKPLTEWIAVSDRIPLESDGEVLVRMRDGRCEIAWATYWHGASNAFAQWTFRDPDEDEAPTHWMPIPTTEATHGIEEQP